MPGYRMARKTARNVTATRATPNTRNRRSPRFTLPGCIALNPTSTPVLVGGLTGGAFISLATGGAHTCAIRVDGTILYGTVFCWGDNSGGQLITGEPEESESTDLLLLGHRSEDADIAIGGGSRCRRRA